MSVTTLKELAIQTARMLNEKYPQLPFLLAEHRPRVHPLTLLFRASLDEQSAGEWEESFYAMPPLSQPPPAFEADGWFYYLGVNAFDRFPVCFFIFKQKPEPAVLQMLETWKEQSRMLDHALQAATQTHETDQGNLISQLLHDVQAIMTLQPDHCKTEALQTRLSYQQKVNENLLLFIRPLELLPSPLPLADLIHSSLQMVNIPAEKYSLTISGSVADINIDAEFMARAIQEIVWNSLQAEAPICAIHARQIPADSPFYVKEWVELSFSDKGRGISSDYLNAVTEPFFTTRKNDGHSGFGLTLVKKITEAHGGYLTIESKKNQGTKVTLYIPV